MKLIIKKCESCEDYTEVYLDDKLLFTGDEYHNKISDYIEGFRKAVEVFKLDISLDTEQTIKCQFYCNES